MNVREAVTAILRKQVDNTNVIESLWILFAGAVEIPTGGTQWIESRRIFFAGALSLFEALHSIMELGAEPTDSDVVRLGQIAKELERFGRDLRQEIA